MSKTVCSISTTSSLQYFTWLCRIHDPIHDNLPFHKLPHAPSQMMCHLWERINSCNTFWWVTPLCQISLNTRIIIRSKIPGLTAWIRLGIWISDKSCHIECIFYSTQEILFPTDYALEAHELSKNTQYEHRRGWSWSNYIFESLFHVASPCFGSRILYWI